MDENADAKRGREYADENKRMNKRVWRCGWMANHQEDERPVCRRGVSRYVEVSALKIL